MNVITFLTNNEEVMYKTKKDRYSFSSQYVFIEVIFEVHHTKSVSLFNYRFFSDSFLSKLKNNIA